MKLLVLLFILKLYARTNIFKNTLVFGNAGDEKNLHPGCRKFIFLTNLINMLEKRTKTKRVRGGPSVCVLHFFKKKF